MFLLNGLAPVIWSTPVVTGERAYFASIIGINADRRKELDEQKLRNNIMKTKGNRKSVTQAKKKKGKCRKSRYIA